MSILPKEKELWLVICNDSEKEIRRKVLIYKSNSKEGFLEVLLCDEDLKMSTNASAIFDEKETQLNYPIATHFDLLATLFDGDNRFIKKIGKISNEAHKFLQVAIGDKSMPKNVKLYEKGLPLVYRSDNRWINREIEANTVEIFTARVEDCIIHTLGWDNTPVYEEELGDLYEGILDPDYEGIESINGHYQLKNPAQFFSKHKYSMKIETVKVA